MLRVEAVGSGEVVIVGPESLLEWRKQHTLKVPGHEYHPLFRRKKWDGTWAPGKWVRQRGAEYELRCSRGLLPRVVRDVGGSVEFGTVPSAEIMEFFQTEPHFGSLRDYQQRAIGRVLKEGWGRVAFATNAGKGAVISLLAKFAERRGEKVLILCDEIAVYDALQGELAKWGGFPVGEVKAGVKLPPWQLVTLAMVPSLARRLADDDSGQWKEWLAQVRMLLCDEADKADANTWRSIIKGSKNTTWRAGFSGSFPDNLYEDLRFDELLGPVIDRVTNSEMVERGVSARPTIEVHAFDSTSTLHTWPKGWWKALGTEKRNFVYERVVINNDARHAFIARLIEPDVPTAVVVNRVDHGRALAAAIPGAVFLDGSSSGTERLGALDAFRDGTVKVIVVTKILDRGTNRLGYAQALIFASGEGSAAQTLQRIGRGLRRSDGKAFLRLVDVVDRIEAHDKRYAAAGNFLHNAARKRLKVYATEGFVVQLVPFNG